MLPENESNMQNIQENVEICTIPASAVARTDFVKLSMKSKKTKQKRKKIETKMIGYIAMI